MGGLNQGCLNAGGRVIGIIHEKFCVDSGEFKGTNFVALFYNNFSLLNFTSTFLPSSMVRY